MAFLIQGKMAMVNNQKHIFLYKENDNIVRSKSIIFYFFIYL